MKKAILILTLIIATNYVKAQTVTIPDTYFAAWLNNNVPSAMSGNQMDTSHVDVKTMYNMFIGFDSIQDLSGIEYFTGLRHLHCGNNRITFIPDLPDSLISFNCSNNMLDSLPALSGSLITIDCSVNNLIALPLSLPDSLQSFNCSANHIDSLPALPVDLDVLICSGNNLILLPVLPDSLTALECSSNSITSLPLLPDSLTRLVCAVNQISALPALPSSLQYLDCGQNPLPSLPLLPASLLQLHCYNDQLTSLPALPLSLQVLVCGNNSLPVLPTLPPSLFELRCYNNLLPVLPVFPSTLQYLDCSNNQLPGLPMIPASLNFINCASNFITALPTLTNGVEVLMCDNNQITNLPSLPLSLRTLNCGWNPLIDLPALNSGLVTLDCSNDGLDSIPALPVSLNSLNCNNNLLQQLPVLPTALSLLDCSNNYLQNLPALPPGLNTLLCAFNGLSGLQSLPSSLLALDCSNNQIKCFSAFPSSIQTISLLNNLFTCLPNYIPVMDPMTLNYPLCVDGDFVNNPYACTGAQGILGYSFADQNSNCIKDTADSHFTNIPVKLYDAAGSLLEQTYTASNGIYNFSKAAGTYMVKVDTTGLPFVPQCPNPGIDTVVSITSTAPLSSGVDFDLGCKPGFDIGIRSVLPSGWVFPGMQHELKIVAGDMSQFYNMNCASGTGGQVVINVSGPVTFAGSTPGALVPVVSGSTFTYNIPDFGSINSNSSFLLNFLVDTTALAGNGICVNISVTPLNGDNDSTNNKKTFCYDVVNSHDPNMKEVYPVDVLPSYDGWFTYTIHFQNTGNAPAMNIRLADTLDSHLDLSTFQVLNYSHYMTSSLKGNAISFRFPNIMLPDSASDPAGSHGYVQYRIKMRRYFFVGTQIENTAYIYFDYNKPIITNTTINELIDYVSSVNENEAPAAAVVYPNPGNGIYNIRINGNIPGEYHIKVYNVMGELVEEAVSVSINARIDLLDQPNGIYLIKISGENLNYNSKLVKQ